MVEVLIAISVLLIAIVGPLTIASKGLQNASFAKEQNTAFFLAQEGLEAVVRMRNDQGLRHFRNNSVDPWAWVDRFANRGCTNGDPCRVNIAPGGNIDIRSCDGNNACDIKLYSGTDPGYRHGSGGAATKYRREIYIHDNGRRVRVLSVVTWDDSGPLDERVELEMYLYNIHDRN